MRKKELKTPIAAVGGAHRNSVLVSSGTHQGMRLRTPKDELLKLYSLRDEQEPKGTGKQRVGREARGSVGAE